MTQGELLSRWSDRRDVYARVAAVVDAAKLIAEFLHDLGELSITDESRALTLRAASEVCGYSVEHLARMVRQGKLRNAGRRYAPRIFASDLPKRREFARTRARSYDVNADARTLKNGRQ